MTEREWVIAGAAFVAGAVFASIGWLLEIFLVRAIAF